MAHRSARANPTLQGRSERATPASPVATHRPTTVEPTIAPRQVLALFTAKDLEALIDTAFHVLQAAVVCDFVSAFYRSAGNGLLKERDSRGHEYGAEFMR